MKNYIKSASLVLVIIALVNTDSLFSKAIDKIALEITNASDRNVIVTPLLGHTDNYKNGESAFLKTGEVKEMLIQWKIKGKGCVTGLKVESGAYVHTIMFDEDTRLCSTGVDSPWIWQWDTSLTHKVKVIDVGSRSVVTDAGETVTIPLLGVQLTRGKGKDIIIKEVSSAQNKIIQLTPSK